MGEAMTTLPTEGMRLQSGLGFATGALIGALGGLIGLGVAEFRLPLLVAIFRLPSLEAVIPNKAMCLAVTTSALPFRAPATPFGELALHLDVVMNLLTGSVAGVWWAAGHAVRMPRHRLDRIIVALLAGLALVMLLEAASGQEDTRPLFANGFPRLLVGIAVGFGIGAVAALLGVAGGEPLIPAIVLLFGLDIKLAGSLSLLVSVPTLMVGLTRYRGADAFAVLRRELSLFFWMAAGSVAGAGLGGLLLGLFSPRVLMGLLSLVLFLSAVKLFRHNGECRP